MDREALGKLVTEKMMERLKGLGTLELVDACGLSVAITKTLQDYKYLTTNPFLARIVLEILLDVCKEVENVVARDKQKQDSATGSSNNPGNSTGSV
jgi:hypothetical protein